MEFMNVRFAIAAVCAVSFAARADMVTVRFTANITAGILGGTVSGTIQWDPSTVLPTPDGANGIGTGNKRRP